MALLEKGLQFSEEIVLPRSKDEEMLLLSPLGKIPFIRTPEGGMCESQAILTYIEASQPSPSLMPSNPFGCAKAYELMTYINLHLELVARELYSEAFFGGHSSEDTKARIKKSLLRNIEGFKRLMKFEPYIAGNTFSLADCVAFMNLSIVGLSTKLVFGEDLLLAGDIEYKSYTKMIGQRPSAQKVIEDRKSYMAAQQK